MRHHVRSAKTSDLVVWEKFFSSPNLRESYASLLAEIRDELFLRTPPLPPLESECECDVEVCDCMDCENFRRARDSHDETPQCVYCGEPLDGPEHDWCPACAYVEEYESRK